MPIGEHPHAWRQEEAAEPIGCADADRPADRLFFAVRSSLCGGVGALNRFSPGKKPFAHFGQSIAAVAPVEKAAVQLFFERVNVACHRRVLGSELLGRSRKCPRPCDRQKISKVIPTLTGLSVRHRLLLINAHRLGIYGPSLHENTITRFGQRTNAVTDLSPLSGRMETTGRPWRQNNPL